jgi:hypothetical protein
MRVAIERRQPLRVLEREWRADARQFVRRRRRFLLYD